MSEPVLLFIKSKLCGHCIKIDDIWPQYTDALNIAYPNLRIITFWVADNSIPLDYNTHPKALKAWAPWAPTILLIPGNEWDAAMAQLGPGSKFEFTKNVKSMNTVFDHNGTAKYVPNYDPSKPSEFVRFVSDGLKDPAFKTGIKSYQPPMPQNVNPIVSYVNPNQGNQGQGQMNQNQGQNHQIPPQLQSNYMSAGASSSGVCSNFRIVGRKNK